MSLSSPPPSCLSPRIIIVGAGPTGLGAALRLVQHEYENFLILDSSDRFGGLANSHVDENGFTWDFGGHVVFSHYQYFDDVLETIGPKMTKPLTRKAVIIMKTPTQGATPNDIPNNAHTSANSNVPTTSGDGNRHRGDGSRHRGDGSRHRGDGSRHHIGSHSSNPTTSQSSVDITAESTTNIAASTNLSQTGVDSTNINDTSNNNRVEKNENISSDSLEKSSSTSIVDDSLSRTSTTTSTACTTSNHKPNKIILGGQCSNSTHTTCTTATCTTAAATTTTNTTHNTHTATGTPTTGTATGTPAATSGTPTRATPGTPTRATPTPTSATPTPSTTFTTTFTRTVDIPLLNFNDKKEGFDNTGFDAHKIRNNYHEIHVINYPIQNHLHQLPKVLRWPCVKGLLDAYTQHIQGDEIESRLNFADWCMKTMGSGLTDVFMRPYNEKLWAWPLESMNSRWLGERVAIPDLNKALYNLVDGREDKPWGPNAQFKYPLRGGSGSIWTSVAKSIPKDKIKLNSKVSCIDTDSRLIIFSDGTSERYDYLISTLPLTELTSNLILSHHSRTYLSQLTSRLKHCSVTVVGLGIKGPEPSILEKFHWSYFSDQDCPFFRCTALNHYSKYMCPIKNNQDQYYSLLFEMTSSSWVKNNHQNPNHNHHNYQNPNLVPATARTHPRNIVQIRPVPDTARGSYHSNLRTSTHLHDRTTVPTAPSRTTVPTAPSRTIESRTNAVPRTTAVSRNLPVPVGGVSVHTGSPRSPKTNRSSEESNSSIDNGSKSSKTSTKKSKKKKAKSSNAVSLHTGAGGAVSAGETVSGAGVSRLLSDKDGEIERIIDCALDYGLILDRDLIVSKYHNKREYGYPTPTIDRDEILNEVLSFLEHEYNIYSRGRFGSWKYECGNMDHSLMQGVEVIDRLILNEFPASYFIHQENSNILSEYFATEPTLNYPSQVNAKKDQTRFKLNRQKDLNTNTVQI